MRTGSRWTRRLTGSGTNGLSRPILQDDAPLLAGPAERTIAELTPAEPFFNTDELTLDPATDREWDELAEQAVTSGRCATRCGACRANYCRANPCGAVLQYGRAHAGAGD